jgi:RNA polymerase primary sigma factor
VGIPTRRHPTLSPQSLLGPYFRDIDATPLLSAAQERDLAHRLRAGDHEARDHLVRANLRLVVKIARSFPSGGLALADLIAEGNLGLIRAAEDYDPAMNTRFSTYAAFWIRHSMKRAVVNSARAIRIPAYMARLLSHWRLATGRLREELGRSPTEGEVAARLRLSAKKLAVVREVLRLNPIAQPEMDLGGPAPADHFVDERTPEPGSTLAQSEEFRRLQALLERLKPTEATVLRLRFGLAGEEPQTLAQIGERLGMSRERARQIEREALKRLHKDLAAD